MFIKDPYSLLAEAANMDLTANTSGVLTESEIVSRLNTIDEVTEDVVITAEMVSVVNVAGDYLVEMNTLNPYMKCNGIKTVAEALNNVAKVNGLEEKSVGLLIESDDYVNALLEKANAKFKKDKNAAAKNKVLEKIKKATDVPAKLIKDGFPVKKKKGSKKVCKECGKNPCVCK